MSTFLIILVSFVAGIWAPIFSHWLLSFFIDEDEYDDTECEPAYHLIIEIFSDSKWLRVIDIDDCYIVNYLIMNGGKFELFNHNRATVKPSCDPVKEWRIRFESAV